MSATATVAQDGYFVASKADFLARSKAEGWSFWRGVTVGFLSGFPLAYIATHGQIVPGIL